MQKINLAPLLLYWVKKVDLNCLTSSSVTWMMGQSAPLQSAEDMKLGGAVNMPGGCGAIPTDLTRLEKWANKNFIKFNKGKQSLTLEKKQPFLPEHAGHQQPGKQLCRKEPGILLDRLPMTEMCPCSKGGNSTLGCVRKNTARGSRKVILPL